MQEIWIKYIEALEDTYQLLITTVSADSDYARDIKKELVIAVIAELVHGLSKYSWTGDVIATAAMTYSTCGFYGQI